MPTAPRGEPPSRGFRSSERFQAEVKAVGARLRAVRKARGLTLDKAAERTGVDLKHIQMIEAGKLNVTVLTLVRLAEGYGVEVREFFGN